MTTGTRESFNRALAKAAELGGLRLVRRELANGRYLVTGSHGREYTVAVSPAGEFSCDCTAGGFGHPCYHQGAVHMLRASQSAFGIVPPAPRRRSDAETRAAILAESRERARTVAELEDRPSLAEIFAPSVA